MKELSLQFAMIKVKYLKNHLFVIFLFLVFLAHQLIPRFALAMRILIKGGVWKNTEDEILKAAVMKYGKNQWARVASLLSRKSAKQCKARWYEWLDPSIKKTEWSREEEEKLLHLAKLMPNQWRSIAPMVGRTAGQCIEHYERLLDQAQSESSAPTNVDDPRRLRPGEIDPTPETKPARPDPIDMDEDEKEMISEARARLANTKGKKAKRKAREKMLEQSRRLTMLQKRRELKAAGVESRLSVSRKRKFMDYAREIPYQKVPPVGFYEVGEENLEAKKMALDPSVYGQELSKMEGRHAQEEEERDRKKDQKKLKDMFKSNAPDALRKIAESADIPDVRRRVPLQLPEPQITENELQQIVKLSKTSVMGPPERLPGFTGTQALIGDYSEALRPVRAPVRTQQQEDIVMQEAKNLIALREMTPLTAHEVPELYEGTGFAGVAPRKVASATPNILSALTTPKVPGTPSLSDLATPRSVAGSISKNSSTNSLYIRDQFGLNASNAVSSDNQSVDFSVSDVSTVFSRTERNRSKAAQQQLLNQLKGLPEPEYTYEVAIPDISNFAEEEEDVRYRGPEDAEDVEKRRRRQLEAARREEMERRSTTLKKGLPRPASIVDSAFSIVDGEGHHLSKVLAEEKQKNPEAELPSSEDLLLAQSLIYEEMHKMVLYEELKYPNDQYGSSAIKRVVEATYDDIEYEIMPKDELLYAQELVQEEVQKRQYVMSMIDYDSFTQSWDKAHEDFVFVPTSSSTSSSSSNLGVWKHAENEKEKVASFALNVQTLQSRYEKNVKKINKLESKLQILTNGYRMKGQQFQKTLQKDIEEWNGAYTNYHQLQQIYQQEIRAAQIRYEKLKNEVEDIEALEKTSQQEYVDVYNYARQIGLILD